jgi:hypothetical protein
VLEDGHEQLAVRLLEVGQGVDPRAADEGVDRAAVGLDRGDGDGPLVVAERAGLLGGLGAVGDGALPRLLGVEDGERDVLDAVAVELDLLGGGVVLGERGGEQEADVALGEQVVGLVARAGGEVGDLGDVEPEGVGVEVGGLLGVADVEADVVDVDERKRVRGLCLGRLARVVRRRWSSPNTPFAGSISFDREVIGLIVRTQTLNDTDALVGAPATAYGSARAIGFLDTVTISGDRTTVSFDFRTGDGTDQIRILVSADPPCNAADLAPIFGRLDLADVTTFVAAFASGDGAGDLNGDGLLDLTDVTLFIQAFVAGCP